MELNDEAAELAALCAAFRSQVWFFANARAPPAHM
jgi:hypothetical protein